MAIGAIGQEPNNSVLRGIIQNSTIPGITTSTWNPRSGGTSKTVFKGKQDQITDLAKQFKSQGIEYSVAGGHIWTLEVTYPWDLIVDNTEIESSPLVTWELVNLPFEKDMWECSDRYFIGLLSADTKNNIDLNLKSNSKTNAAWLAPQDTTQPNATEIMGSALVAQNLKKSGVRGKQSVVQSLKRTVIVPTYTLTGTNSLLVSSDSDFTVFTKGELLAYLNSSDGGNPLNQIPSLISNKMPSKLWVMPKGSTTPVLTEGMTFDKNYINTFIGYLQYPSEYSMVSNLKTQITQHWVFNQWSAGSWGLYDTHGGDIGTNPGDYIG